MVSRSKHPPLFEYTFVYGLTGMVGVIIFNIGCATTNIGTNTTSAVLRLVVLIVINAVLVSFFGIKLLNRANRRDTSIASRWKFPQSSKSIDQFSMKSIGRKDHMRNNSRLLEQVAEALPDLLYVDDLIHNRNIFINDKAVAILGYAPEELKRLGATRFQEIMHPDDQATNDEWLSRLADS